MIFTEGWISCRVLTGVELGVIGSRADTEVKGMATAIVRRDGEEVTVSVTIRLDGAMLEAEEAIQVALNEAGVLLEQENLARFDVDWKSCSSRARPVLQQGEVAPGVRDALRAGLGRTSCLPDGPGREDFLPPGRQRPADAQFHPALGQDRVVQVRQLGRRFGRRRPAGMQRPDALQSLLQDARRRGENVRHRQGGILGVRQGAVPRPLRA